MKSIDGIFREFADCFIGRISGKTDIAMPEALERAELDFTLGSLNHVDRYLEKLHRLQNRLGGNGIENTILWGGAYVGEIIRRNSKRLFSWVDYDDYAPNHPEIIRIVGERTLATCAFLCTDTSMTMPINKVARCIYEGPENNLHYYASGECEPGA